MVNEQGRILIVDDNPGMARTTSMILERKGYSVSTAGGGQEALEAVKREPFDMILMDIGMPVMDGVEAHRQIKKIRPAASVMMMTAYAVEDVVQRVLEDGALGVMDKPLDFDRVAHLIEQRPGRIGAGH